MFHRNTLMRSNYPAFYKYQDNSTILFRSENEGINEKTRYRNTDGENQGTTSGTIIPGKPKIEAQTIETIYKVQTVHGQYKETNKIYTKKSNPPEPNLIPEVS